MRNANIENLQIGDRVKARHCVGATTATLERRIKYNEELKRNPNLFENFYEPQTGPFIPGYFYTVLNIHSDGVETLEHPGQIYPFGYFNSIETALIHVKNSQKKTFWDAPEFKAKLTKWTETLIKDGFQDPDRRIVKGKLIESEYVTKQEFQIRSEWEPYFEKCFAFLRLGKLKDKHDIFIFTWHCHGHSDRQIVDLLKETSGYRKFTQPTISSKIHKILKIANIKPVDFQTL